MQYGQVEKGVFLARPNRFIALVALNGVETVCHVKNTGRCRELLVPGAAVYLEKGTNPGRKTAYDLIAVEKNGKLINMDAQAPNKAFAEWALRFDPTATAVHSEYRFGQSRLDFCLETPKGLHLVPVEWLTERPPTLYRYPLRPMIGADFPFDTVQRDNSYPWEDGRMEVPVYEGLPYPLWGLTARITYYLLKDVPS